jgi:hypothetical protein
MKFGGMPFGRVALKSMKYHSGGTLVNVTVLILLLSVIPVIAFLVNGAASKSMI